MAYTPIYEPFDLGQIDPSLEGTSISILRNPKRGFRTAFWGLSGPESQAAILYILGLEDDPPGDGAKSAQDKHDEIFGDIEAYVWTALFAGAAPMSETGKREWTLPHVYKIWDRYADEQIKKLAGR
jgi:hypothetical protein